MSKTLYDKEQLQEYFWEPESGGFTIKVSPQWLYWLWGSTIINDDEKANIYAVTLEESTGEASLFIQLERGSRP